MNTWPRIATVTLNPAIDLTVSAPNFRAGQVNRARAWQSDPGGKGVNVASILADCGFPVAVTGFLGAENDQGFRRLFEQKGIDDRFVRIPGSTRTGIKLVDDATQTTTDINFPGLAPSQAELAQLTAIVAALAADHQWLVFSGSIPARAPDAIYRDLLQQVQGCRVALDTSGAALRQALTAAPTVIKPNLEELSELLGRPLAGEDAILAAARSFIQRGVETVVVSMGPLGALFVEAHEAVAARPPAAVARSTVGAGDALLAGIVAGKCQGLTLPACARLATAFAVDAIGRIGPGLASLAAVAALAQQVTVQAL